MSSAVSRGFYFFIVNQMDFFDYLEAKILGYVVTSSTKSFYSVPDYTVWMKTGWKSLIERNMVETFRFVTKRTGFYLSYDEYRVLNLMDGEIFKIIFHNFLDRDCIESHIHRSVRYGHSEYFKNLVNRLYPNYPLSQEFADDLLQKACDTVYGNLEIVKHLMTVTTANPNFEEHRCILKACDLGHVEIVRYLLGLSDIHIELKNYWLQYTSGRHELESVKYQYGIDCERYV